MIGNTTSTGEKTWQTRKNVSHETQQTST